MFNFSKSRETPTLNNKTDIQYKVLCDWLRTTEVIVKRIHKQNQIITLDIAKLYDLLLKDDSPPENMDLDLNDDSSTSRSIS